MRMSEGLTQIQLAEKADLSHNYVGEIERGEKLASLESIVQLAAALRLSASDQLAKAGF
jgi:transcriptional regulator with XRE-family HTH domain